MIISPPFLPHGTYASDDAFIEAAMVESGEGFYPVSGEFCWHNGMHLVTPDTTNQAPVCAIADGIVRYRQEPTQKSTNPSHPQNYNPRDDHHPAWTDNGMVIIEHSTEIGARGNTPTTITYYSLYYHLSKLDTSLPLVGQPIYRKMPLGQAGQIYGSQRGEIHFEICCNAENLRYITGHQAEPNGLENKNQPPAQDGRTDSVFGSMYFYLPANTPITSGNQQPANNAQTSPLNTPIWVRLSYVDSVVEGTVLPNSAVALTSYYASGDQIGAQIGNPQVTKSFEYNHFTVANNHHTAQPEISSSDWYELLRFGRKLNGSAIPSTIKHWRQISTPVGLVWANLNAANVRKFSDADFLPIMGWNFYQDDPNHHDQRCNSTDLKVLIRNPDSSDIHRMEPEQLMKRVKKDTDGTRTNKLKRVIAKFATEWDQTTIVQRCEWIKHEPEFQENPDDWTKLLSHVQGITCTSLPQAYKDAQWHFHPKEFIKIFRQCGWLNLQELRQLLPMNSIRKLGPNNYAWESVSLNGAFGLLAENDASALQRRIELNKALRKYGVNTKIRIACFFGNATQETQWYQKFHEGSPYWYKPWDGRGFLQLTHAGNYITYWEFKGTPISQADKTSLEQHTTLANSARQGGMNDPTNSLSDANTHISQTTISMRGAVETDAATRADTAGAYWAWTKASSQADTYSNSYIRRSLNTGAGAKIYYENNAFAYVAATVNLGHPSQVFSAIWGIQARFMSFANAAVILLDSATFPYADNQQHSLPENFTYRR